MLFGNMNSRVLTYTEVYSQSKEEQIPGQMSYNGDN